MNNEFTVSLIVGFNCQISVTYGRMSITENQEELLIMVLSRLKTYESNETYGSNRLLTFLSNESVCMRFIKKVGNYVFEIK